jgi:hypothetical protein
MLKVLSGKYLGRRASRFGSVVRSSPHALPYCSTWDGSTCSCSQSSTGSRCAPAQKANRRKRIEQENRARSGKLVGSALERMIEDDPRGFIRVVANICRTNLVSGRRVGVVCRGPRDRPQDSNERRPGL